MSRLNINNLTNENEDGSPSISGISTFSSTHYFVPPSGSTAERPSHADPGMIRFNTDSGHLEYYNGVEWTSVIVNNNELGGGTGSNTGTGTRAFFGGGLDPGTSTAIDFLTISTLGNAQDFGDLTGARQRMGACASNTIGILAGGYTGSGFDDQIQKITIASTGNATDTGGNLTGSKNRLNGCSNSTRGLFAYGNPSSNVIEYITISSDGNAVDFGDTSYAAEGGMALASSVRGVFMGGETPGSPSTPRNNIEYVTISSTGNAQDFGDLTYDAYESGSFSSATRGVVGGGLAANNSINFLTIATTGNAQDFGDLTDGRGDTTGASSTTRGVWFGGADPALIAIIDYVEIASTGNAVDFGDPNDTRSSAAGSSNGHGGL
jgi:hypothetical protein